MKPFEFATANRILFGAGQAAKAAESILALGQVPLLVTGGNPERAAFLRDALTATGVTVTAFTVPGEPTLEQVAAGVAAGRAAGCDVVIALGGGSAIDAGKAIAALLTNHGHPLDYLEVIGRGQPLTQTPLPCVAIPTTAGAGAEVTKNAVLSAPAHKIKVSLRHPALLPNLAVVDPRLTHSLPPEVTACTGLDALTQCLEPLVTPLANPFSDAFARTGLPLAAQFLRRAVADGTDADAREGMALASLCGGLALANAKLGAIHGFAGPLGGRYGAPHGAICAALLAPVTAVNIRALAERAPEHPSRTRYDEAARLLTGRPSAIAADAVPWLTALVADLAIPTLSQLGVDPGDLPGLVRVSAATSSMKGNPIPLRDEELAEILERAL